MRNYQAQGETELQTPSLQGVRMLIVGASAGIGRELAKQAVARGADVCIAARRITRLLDIQGAHPIQADIADEKQCRDLIEQTVDRLRALDLIVHSAGVGELARIDDTDGAEWRRFNDVNVIGPTLVTAAALPYLTADALVAFLSSEVADETRWGMSGYAASKAALDTTIRNWRVEHPERRFMRIAMGATSGTEFGDSFGRELLTIAFDRWAANGIPLILMDVSAVGCHLADVMALALAHPTIDIPEFNLKPRGQKWSA